MKSEGDFEKFVTAFQIISKDGSLAGLVNQHGHISGHWNHAHFTPRFLVWHRLYLKEFELLIQKAGAPYLPYWDWTLYSQQPWLDPVLGAEYFGSPDATYAVSNSAFAKGKYSTPVGGKALVREYSATGPTTAFHAYPLIQRMITGSNSFSIFSRNIEYGPHAVVHSMLGGKSGDMSGWTSPNDPLFWVHHCFIDKIFADWQAEGHATDFDAAAYPDHSTMKVSELIMPYGVPISNILNPADVCMGGYINTPASAFDEAPKLTNVSAPSIGDNWLNNSGADKDIAKEVQDEDEKDVANTNDDISKGIDVNQRSNGGLRLIGSAVLTVTAAILIALFV
jgi:tyrosinase